jgi:hypothetical protein
MQKFAKLAMAARRAMIALSIMLTGLALTASLTPVVQASLDGCRSDPVIYLSDGTALDVTADIGTSVSNVTTIAYFVHVPPGLHMILYLATPTLGFKGKEVFTLYNDAPAGQYKTDTYVLTVNKAVAVTSQTTLVGLYLTSLRLSLQSKPASGYSGHHIWTTIYR